MNFLKDKIKEAAMLSLKNGYASTSLFVRFLEINYNESAEIIDALEQNGIVGKFEGGKSRDVLVHSEVEINELLNRI